MSTTSTASTALTTYQAPQIAVARGIDAAAWNALKEIYDGASDEKVALVFDYCKARRLDPLKKPVHIVPVYSHRRRTMVETIWPSIAETRITAMRTGLYAGKDKTIFGPTQTMDLGSAKGFTFPEWAETTVYRVVKIGDKFERVPFQGPRVYWLETYANRGKDDYTPNSMWQKRAWGQLDKCTEAAALRAAFPEELGGQATAEEMHGRVVDDDPIELTPMTKLDEQAPAGAENPAEGQGTAPAGDAAKATTRAKVPRKAKGAAGMREEPKAVDPVEPPKTVESKPDAAPEPTVDEEVARQANEGTLGAAMAPKPAESPDPEPEKKPEPPAPAEEKPAAKEEPKPEPAKPAATAKRVIPPGGLATLSYPRYPQTPGWPKSISVTIDEVTDRRGKDASGKEYLVKACRLGRQGKDLGLVIFDYENQALCEQFAKVSDAEVTVTIEQWPSTTSPGRFLTVIVGAEDDVMM